MGLTFAFNSCKRGAESLFINVLFQYFLLAYLVVLQKGSAQHQRGSWSESNKKKDTWDHVTSVSVKCSNHYLKIRFVLTHLR